MGDQFTQTGFSVDDSGNVTAQKITTQAGRVRKYVTKTAAYTLVAGDDIVAWTTLAAARAATLPLAASVAAGHEFDVRDWSGNAGTNNINLTRSGSDTLNGGTSVVAISTAYGRKLAVSDGVSNWLIT